MRTDWDFAFHAYDFRTNSGAAGSGNAGAAFIADAVSAGETPLSEVYAGLTIVETWRAVSLQTTIPVFGWAKGIYMVKISSATGSQIQKVIVK